MNDKARRTWMINTNFEEINEALIAWLDQKARALLTRLYFCNCGNGKFMCRTKRN